MTFLYFFKFLLEKNDVWKKITTLSPRSHKWTPFLEKGYKKRFIYQNFFLITIKNITFLKGMISKAFLMILWKKNFLPKSLEGRVGLRRRKEVFEF
jgi:hypothetical protein